MGHWDNLGFEDAAYVLDKAGVGISQLASGIPAPQYPVHGQDVGEKLLEHFGASETLT